MRYLVTLCLALGLCPAMATAQPTAPGTMPPRQPVSTPARPVGGPQSSWIVGAWGTGTTSNIVDGYSGQFKRTFFTGENYEFRPDGTFEYYIMSEGSVFEGLAITTGRYQLRGNVVYLSDCHSSFRAKPGSGEQSYQNRRDAEKDGAYPVQLSGRDLAISFPTAPAHRKNPSYLRKR